MLKRCDGCFEQYESEFGICPFCGYYDGAEPAEPVYLPVGTMLKNRYFIGNVKNCGGFGILYKAWDCELDTVVAIKEFYPLGMVNRVPGSSKVIISGSVEKTKRNFDYSMRRFLNEARNVAKFNSNPNIVSVYSYFEENNTAYIVMEFLDGYTMLDLMKENGGFLPIDFALDTICHVCDALKDVHKSGLIHRDISPDNIFICRDASVRLIDFGAARLADDDNSIEIILKAGFAPPEQYDNAGVQDNRTDVYAVGATLYYAVTGQKPVASLDRKFGRKQLIPVNELKPETPQYVVNCIAKAMAIEPNLRFESVDEFKSVIEKKKEVIDPEKDKKRRKRKRAAKLVAMASVFTAIAVVLVSLVTSINKSVVLDDATINVWYIIEDGQNKSSTDAAFEKIKETFQKDHNNIEINFKGISAAEYCESFSSTDYPDELPDLFIYPEDIESGLALADLADVICDAPKKPALFTTGTTDSKLSEDFQLLEGYQDTAMIPMGFNVQVYYIKSGFDFDVSNCIDISVLSTCEEKYNQICAEEVSYDIIDVGDLKNGTADVCFGDTGDYYFAKEALGQSVEYKLMTAERDSDGKVLCSYEYYWCVSGDNEAEDAAAKCFLGYILANSDIIMGETLYPAIPISQTALARETLAPELKQIVDTEDKNWCF